jgi:indolepyruvate ferredoxin oxidoreductase alpha subunit
MYQQHDSRERMSGHAALAQGALAAGVQVVTGYPGSPATEVFDCLLGHDLTHIEWAANEKVAMELAAGASLGGSRALVVLKSVGLNVALDSLATLSMTGCHAGLVILLGDDPGGAGSQNEQDSRWLARTAEVPLVEPLSVEQAAALMAQAFAWSEANGVPVIVRITRGLTTDSGLVAAPWQLPAGKRGFLRGAFRWISYPPLVVRRHRGAQRRLAQMAQMIEASPYDAVSGQGALGILAVGHAHAQLQRLLSQGPDGAPGAPPLPATVLGLSSVWPLPEQTLRRWLAPLERLLILEEGGPFVEEQLGALLQCAGLTPVLLGRASGHVPTVGALQPDDLSAALHALWPTWPQPEARSYPSVMPTELCPDCLYRLVFTALIEGMEAQGGRDRFITVGETGCMVRAVTPPFQLLDVKLSLGSALGLGLGLAISQPAKRVVSLVGDSSFFHSDLNALPQAIARHPNLLLLVLDNQVTALTGGQPHPGSDRDALGRQRAHVADIAQIMAALGLEPVTVNALDGDDLMAKIRDGLAADGLSALVVHAPCCQHLPGVA